MTEKILTEGEWDAKFGWSSDEDGDSNVLDADDEAICMLLRRVGVQFVWSQQDRDDGGCVPQHDEPSDRLLSL